MFVGSDNEDEFTSSSESHEVNGDTANGGGNEGENGDGDTPPNSTPAQGVC